VNLFTRKGIVTTGRCLQNLDVQVGDTIASGHRGRGWAANGLGKSGVNAQHAVVGEAGLQLQLGQVVLAHRFGQGKFAHVVTLDVVVLRILDFVASFNANTPFLRVEGDVDFFGLVAAHVETAVQPAVAFAIHTDGVGKSVIFHHRGWARWHRGQFVREHAVHIAEHAVEGAIEVHHVATHVTAHATEGHHWPVAHHTTGRHHTAHHATSWHHTAHHATVWHHGVGGVGHVVGAVREHASEFMATSEWGGSGGAWLAWGDVHFDVI